MGKNKLKKFGEMDTIDFVFQYPYARLQSEGFGLRGRWREHFGNDNPITLELGCGKGEYTVGLARRFPDRNFIGVDIKGARMWSGATAARDEGLRNVAFIRTDIALLASFFAPGEVDEIWITFADPQMRKVNKRLTGTRFMQLYRRVLRPDGRINLKTDSPFLYTYTRMMARLNDMHIHADSDDLYGHPETLPADYAPLLDIRTFYEQQWLDRGLTIKYLAFDLHQDRPLQEVTEEIPMDTYRSFSRGVLETGQWRDRTDKEITTTDKP